MEDRSLLSGLATLEQRFDRFRDEALRGDALSVALSAYLASPLSKQMGPLPLAAQWSPPTSVDPGVRFDPISDQTVLEDSSGRFVAITGITAPYGVPLQKVILTAQSSEGTIIRNPVIRGAGATRTLSITPAANASGAATIHVTAWAPTHNGLIATFQQSFAVNVLPVNDAPTFDPVAHAEVLENAGYTEIAITGIGAPSSEPEQQVILKAFSSNNSIIANPQIIGSGSTRMLRFAPVPHAFGTVSILVIAQDNGGTANGGIHLFERTFTIDVLPVEDGLSFDPIANRTVLEDSGAGEVPITGISGSTSLTGVLVTAVSSNPGVIPDLVVVGSGNARVLRFAPAANAFGTATITVTARDTTADGILNLFERTFTIDVSPVNDAPTFDPLANLILQPGSGFGELLITGIAAPGSEPEQNVVLTAVSSNPALVPDPVISGSGATRTLRYAPDSTGTGTATITVTARDDGGTSHGGIDVFQRTFTMTMLPASGNVTFDPIANRTVLEDSGLAEVTITGVAPSDQSLTFTAVSSAGAIVPNPTVTGTGATRTLRFTPPANAHGTATITVTAHGGGLTDGSENSLVRTFTVDVIPVNDAPTFDPIAPRTIPEGAESLDVAITGISALELGQNVVVTAVSSDQGIIPDPIVTGTGAARSLQLIAAAHEGIVTITVTARDNGGTASGGSDLFQRTFVVSIAHEHEPAGPDYELDVIDTHHDKFPNFVKNPTIIVTQSGLWSQLPALAGATQDDIVFIAEGADVVFDVPSARVGALGVAGNLRFAPDVNTHLTVTNLMVFSAGYLEIGTKEAPIDELVTARISIADRPLDIASDPSQYGNGLIAFGKIVMHGRTLAETSVRLTQEPRAGDTVLHLGQVPTGWRVGDHLVLPDTSLSSSDHSESLIIAAITGGDVTLAAPLTSNHLGARNGDLATIATRADGESLLPHVANVSRNVVLDSENPLGVRGHVQFAGRAWLDARYVALNDLGRTTMADLDSTQFDDEGNVTHLGTNQVGRYSLHVHHVAGPRNPMPADPSVDRPGVPVPQYRLVGNAINGALKWGIALHDSHYGLIKDNVVYDTQGAGIITEDGSESFNVFEGNFVAKVAGNGATDRYDPEGRRGAGFWLRGNRNYFYDNVVADAGEGYGFYIQNDSGNSQQANLIVHVPLFPGADTHHDGEYALRSINSLELPAFAGNETYNNRFFGIGLWSVQMLPVDQAPVFEDTTIWHIRDTAVFMDYSAAIMDGLVIRGEASQPGIGVRGHNPNSIHGYPLTVRNFDFQLLQHMYQDDARPAHEAIFENGFVRDYRGFLVRNNQEGTSNRRYVLRNVDFEAVAGQPFVAIETQLANDRWRNAGTWDFDAINHAIQVLVYDYEGIAGNDFRVYFNEQSPNYVIDSSSHGVEVARHNAQFFPGLGQPVWIPETRFLPEAGLTNAQSWAKYRAAILNEVAPSTDTTTHPEIIGITSPLATHDYPAFPNVPTPFFWFQENRTTDLPGSFNILYHDFVVQGAAAIHFHVDDGPAIVEADNDGLLRLTDLTAGTHTISAFLADEEGNEWANRVRFTIQVLGT